MKSDQNWMPDATDVDWIESIARASSPAALAIEAAAGPLHIPIVDRHTGRVLSVLAAGRRRVVEVGTAYGYSTLWLALGQPADGTIVTIDPDRARTDLARGWWRDGGIADDRIRVINQPALDALASRHPDLAGPFDLAFIDALKGEYEGYLDALIPRLAADALVIADNVLWSGRVSGSRPGGDDPDSAALRRFSARVAADRRFESTVLPLGDGLLVAAWRGGSLL